MHRTAREAADLFQKRYGVIPTVEVFYDPMRMQHNVMVKVPAVSTADYSGDFITSYGDDDILANYPVSTVNHHPPESWKFVISDEALYRGDSKTIFDSLLENLEAYPVSSRYQPQDIAELITYSVMDKTMSVYNNGGLLNGGQVSAANITIGTITANNILPLRAARANMRKPVKKFNTHMDVLKKWLK